MFVLFFIRLDFKVGSILNSSNFRQEYFTFLFGFVFGTFIRKDFSQRETGRENVIKSKKEGDERNNAGVAVGWHHCSSRRAGQLTNIGL